jgi:hypothetical protein
MNYNVAIVSLDCRAMVRCQGNVMGWVWYPRRGECSRAYGSVAVSVDVVVSCHTYTRTHVQTFVRVRAAWGLYGTIPALALQRRSVSER